MKKIFWLIQQLEAVGGTEMVSTQIMNGLCDSFDVTLVCSGEKPINQIPYQIDERIKIIYLNINKNFLKFDEYYGYLINHKRFIKMIVEPIKLAFFWSFLRFSYRKKIKKLTTEDDIIIASSLDNYAISPRKRKVYFHFHFNAKFFFNIGPRLGFLFCRKPDKWIMLTNTTHSKIITKRPILKPKIVSIYNPTRYARHRDLTPKNNNLIFIGRYVAQKRPLLAIDMAYELKKLNVNFTFSFYGDGPLKIKMKELVLKYGLENNVFIYESNPNIINEIRKCDLLIMTSEFEGFGLVILEANSQSVPAITLYWGDATKEIVQDGKNGFVIDNDDIKQQALLVKQLLENQDQLAELKKSSFEFSSTFSKEIIINKWKEILISK